MKKTQARGKCSLHFWSILKCLECFITDCVIHSLLIGFFKEIKIVTNKLCTIGFNREIIDIGEDIRLKTIVKASLTLD